MIDKVSPKRGLWILNDGINLQWRGPKWSGISPEDRRWVTLELAKYRDVGRALLDFIKRNG